MIIRQWINAFAIGAFLWILLIGFADFAAARGRQGHPPRFRYGFGLHGHHHFHGYSGYYPFWRFHYYGDPFWFYYDGPYYPAGYYWAPNFRLPAFFHYPGAIGKGEITLPRPAGEPAVQESPPR